jgi:hypothetical protein
MDGSSAVGRQTLRQRRWTALWTTVAGLAVLSGSVVLVRSWRSELPDPVASHWGADGTANGFSSLDAVIAVMFVGGTVLVLGFGAVTLGLGQTAWVRRTGAAASVWSAVFFATLTVGSLAPQRGLSDARDAGGIGGVLVLAYVLSLAAAGITAAAVPGDPHQPTAAPVPPDAPRAEVGAGEPAGWSGSARSPTAMFLAFAAGTLVIALVALTRLWALLIVAVVVVGLVTLMASVVVRVDEDGVTIGSPLGWPRLRIPLDEVVRADVTRVRPLRDFGGWGWRVGRAGRVGVALRAGEALLVQRTGDRSVVVTVDHATAAAGTVNALVDRVRERHDGAPA